MIEVEVEDAAWTTALPEVVEIVEQVAEAALKVSPCEAGGGDQTKSGEGGGLAPPLKSLRQPTPSTTLRAVPLPCSAEEDFNVTVLLTDDASIQSLNARFRGKDAVTNVLSFPAPESAAPHLGDIALAYGVCAQEAQAQLKSLQHHLMHLTAHGVLHLLGYDHETDAEAEEMEGIERAILATLGVPDPYAEPGASPEAGAEPNSDETHAL